MTGKSGRGKTVFLRYLIFFILLEAKAARKSKKVGDTDYVTNPRIAFVDRDQTIYFITTDIITTYNNRAELVAETGHPHFFFSDSSDVDDAGAGSHLTMALSSGDNELLKNFTKRREEAHSKTRSELVMPGLNFTEMLEVFSTGLFDKDQITFAFDVVGGNPRLAFAPSVANRQSTYYPIVVSVVKTIFPSESEKHQRWASDVVCSALDKAVQNKAGDALDSSTFKEFMVSDIVDGVCVVNEVFSSQFMGFVASCINSAAEEESKKATLLKLFGSPGAGVFFEYQTQLSFLAADPGAEYICLCKNTGKLVSLCLGGGNLKLIHTIQDLSELEEGECGMPTVPNFAIVDKVLIRGRKKYGIQMTNGLTHNSRVSKLPEMLNALKIKHEKDFFIVFVVPEQHLSKFIFPTNLGKVSLFLTASTPCSTTVITNEIKKRKK